MSASAKRIQVLSSAHVAKQLKDAGSVARSARERLRTPRCAAAICAALTLLLVGTDVPSAGAELPDGRVYEQVSPVHKNGEEAGANSLEGATRVEYTVASPDGESVLYGGTGPFGAVTSGSDFFSVARRSPGSGWSTTAALPPALGDFAGEYLSNRPISILPAQGMSSSVFTAGASFAPGDPSTGSALHSEGVFRAALGGAVSWLSEPTEGTSPVPEPGHLIDPLGMLPVGGSPDLETVYFGYYGTLLPADASRAPHVEEAANGTGLGPWGFYEWNHGVLSSAGVLPDGHLDEFGAVPAGGTARFNNSMTPDDFDNEVSEDGSRAFFVSPDPFVSPVPGSSHAPESDPPELYVREGGHSILVSRDELAGGVPAPGPAGTSIVAIQPPDTCGRQDECASYAFASPDGSRVFFESGDVLARSAGGEVPTGPGPWAYEFELESEALTYLPGVTDGTGGTASILTSSEDGSRFLFDRNAPGTPSSGPIPTQLDLYSGGRATTIAQLPTPTTSELPNGTIDAEGGHTYIAPARSSTDGSVFVFETNSPLLGAENAAANAPTDNNGGGYNQVYRYEIASATLSCLSCPGIGVPSGDARLSNDDEQIGTPSDDSTTKSVLGSRGISADGGRVFFDSPDALVPQDTNGQRDVYEWEGGKLHLISGGTSPRPSFFLDNSASGDDVFFATAEGISPEDTDGSYDVYDAKVGGGFPQPETPVPCATDCQGEGTVPPVFAPSPSESTGEGNLEPKAKAKHPKKHRHHRRKKHRKHRHAGADGRAAR